jgi:hypothetical protein
MDALTTQFVSDVDRLGILLAQIADLTKEANAIKADLKGYTQFKTFEGNLFRAVVVEQEKTTYDSEVLKLAADPAILELAKRESFVVSVKVTARAAD